MNKNLLILIVVAGLLVAGGIWFFGRGTYTVSTSQGNKTQNTPQQGILTNDTTALIGQDLNLVDITDNLDQEFQSIDTDIKNL